MTERPALNARLRDKTTGREVTVIEHTARGFTYKGEPYPFIPRMGTHFTGEGEIFCDVPGWDWRAQYDLIEPNFSI